MDKKSLKTRVITTLLVASLVGLIVFVFPNWAFTGLAAFFIGMALSEFFGMVEKKGIFVYKYFGIIVGMLIPVMAYLQKGLEGYFAFEPFVIVIACLFIFVLHFARRDSFQALTSVAVTMFGLLYIAWFLSFFIKIKFLPGGTLLVAFLILVTKTNDIGAYLIGSAIGRHALIPRISPKKTVEGTVGGIAISIVSALASKSYLPSMPYGHLFMLGLILGILTMVGDLAESLLKRDCGVKDAGMSLAGLGGVLDMLDSLLFTTPIFYFYVVVMMR